MKSEQAVRVQNHCTYIINYHLVIVTKYRKKCLTNEMLNRIEELTKERIEAWDGELSEFNGEPDHLHILLTLPPKHAIADFVNAWKTGTSRRLRNENEDHLKRFYRKSALWSRSYFVATCGGAPLEVIKQYIEQQERPV